MAILILVIISYGSDGGNAISMQRMPVETCERIAASLGATRYKAGDRWTGRGNIGYQCVGE